VDLKDFLKAIGSISSSWSLAAYAIAAVIAILNVSASQHRKAPTNSIIWALAVIICILGLAPTVANAYLSHLAAQALTVYRVRTLVLDPEHVPVSGATLRTTASNETTQTFQGVGIVAVYRATMPADGKVSIYADLDSAFLHGHTDVQLANDPNPSMTIELKANGNATVSGLVEDNAGHSVPGATVTALGGESGVTTPNGTFSVKTNAAAGQQVRLHVEKDGYRAVDQDHPAGREPVTIVIEKIKRTR
jgi:hypothetical protein